MWDELAEEVEFELSQIRRLLDEYEGLLQSASEKNPGGKDTLALAGALHCFYNGIENIFKRIAGKIDGGLPRNGAWHRKLLDSMTTETPNRPAVINPSIYARIEEYLRFRHRFRYSYSFDLDWEEMSPLALGCKETLQLLEAELNEFLKH